MKRDQLLDSKHFTLQSLADGVYACIDKPGGGAFSNAGIIYLGDRTLIVDAFNARAASSDLRQTAETLFKRPVEIIFLTHGHLDHWIGACAFDVKTAFVATKTVQQVCLKWAPRVLEDYQNPSLWEEMLLDTKETMQGESDRCIRADHEHMLTFIQYVMAERTEFQPRTPNQTFENNLRIQGSVRTAEFHSLGGGHSEEDCVVLLPQDGIAFMGDIGFFDMQPQLNVYRPDLLRHQMQFFEESKFQTLVPGHGPVGDKKNLATQSSYMDLMKEEIRKIIQKRGSVTEAL